MNHNVFTGEHLKDVDQVLLAQDPILDHKFPRPITERSHCGGIWEALEEEIKEDELVRDCYAEGYIQPLATCGCVQLLNCMSFITSFRK